MFNNRMLAVAAVLVMAVPALGAATPIVVPAVPEQLVEGHTVFTVIEIAKVSNTTESRFAAAVAVLVREYQAANKGTRFPGVLWFNDQYLVSPEQGVSAGNAIRYPCGGAVMAVNRGDPDPRMVMVRTDVDGDVTTFGTSSQTYSGWNYPADGTYSYGSDAALVGADVDTASGTATVSSDTLVSGAVWDADPFGVAGPYDYEKSYLITDPNDHSWVIDVYNFYTRDSVTVSADPANPVTVDSMTADNAAGADPTRTSYGFKVWVVNLQGSPVFRPDEGTFNTCLPFVDTIQTVLDTPDGTVTCTTQEDPTELIGDQSVQGTPNVQNRVTDDPCAGYDEPSTNGYCYAGQPQTAAGTCPNGPDRYYNALLYFELQDLSVAGAAKDHSVASTDTNGCAQETTSPQASMDYPCPGGDDDLEGNSHPFHPESAGSPPHTDEETCDPYFEGDGANHGGSTYTDPGVDGGEWFAGGNCDDIHGTRNIDIYFSGAGRPWAPITRNFVITDTDGSNEPFHGVGTAPNPHAS